MSRILRSEAARRDLVEIVRHYAREAGLTTARQFRSEAEGTFERLARMPEMGAPYEHEHPALAGTRFFPISRFPNYLILYLPMPDGITVLRVLHSARDIPGILAEQFVSRPEPVKQGRVQNGGIRRGAHSRITRTSRTPSTKG